jgi:hypothetical protein
MKLQSLPFCLHTTPLLRWTWRSQYLDPRYLERCFSCIDIDHLDLALAG